MDMVEDQVLKEKKDQNALVHFAAIIGKASLDTKTFVIGLYNLNLF